MDWSGEVRANEIVDCSGTYQGSRHAMLFSGVVDSLTSFVVHREKKPRLVTIWGADIGLAHHHRWEQASTQNRVFAESKSLDISFIKTNFRTFFNSYILKAKFESLDRFSKLVFGDSTRFRPPGACLTNMGWELYIFPLPLPPTSFTPGVPIPKKITTSSGHQLELFTMVMTWVDRKSCGS
jgi:hypothetical protein